MCNCIDNFNKLYREETGDVEAGLETVFSIVKKNKAGQIEMFAKMTASYRPKKKDGSFGKQKRIVIQGDFCPFCGKANNEEGI